MKKIYLKDNQAGMTLFDPNLFVHQILSEAKMLSIDPQLLDELSLKIEKLLAERINQTVITAFEEKHLILFNNIMEDNPEISPAEAVSIVAGIIPGIHDLVFDSIEDLYEELLEYVKMIDQALEDSKN